MDIPEKKNEKVGVPKPPLQEFVSARKKTSGVKLDVEGLNKFFNLTGGSILYCLSAVFIAYGIVNVMGPILSKGEALMEALPCIFTLHVYELALLGVLVLIVTRKVVDDAISVAILTALFLVGTSIALGSVADTDITASLWLGLIGVAIAFGKFYVMRRFAGIAFRVLSVLGLGVLVICNYFGPAILARSVLIEPSQESARRGLWWLIGLAMLIGAGLVLIEAMRGKPRQQAQSDSRPALLQTPVMVYFFALLIVAASGVHQYAMAFTSGLERVLGDYVPITAVGVLLVLEILRHLGKRFGIVEVVILCVPFAVTMLTIEEKSVLSSGQVGLELLGYPPVILALTGLAIAGLALYHRRYMLLGVAVFYGLGVILTAGFSPEHPYDLNIKACAGTLVVLFVVYGLIIRNPYVCIEGIIILCVGLSQWDVFSRFAKSYDLTEVGGLAGVFGLSATALCLLFGSRVHKTVRVVGALCLAGFMFDYLSEYTYWRYAIVLFGTVSLTAGLWFRTRDILVIFILWMPFLVRLYIVAKRIAYWRFVIVGFLLLGAGTIASLFKHRIRDRVGPETHRENSPIKL